MIQRKLRESSLFVLYTVNRSRSCSEININGDFAVGSVKDRALMLRVAVNYFVAKHFSVADFLVKLQHAPDIFDLRIIGMVSADVESIAFAFIITNYSIGNLFLNIVDFIALILYNSR